MRKGFTLVEVAVVLVVIGILAGGVLLGVSMVQQAKVRSFVGEVNRIYTSVALFSERYRALPGDMFNATEFWQGQTNDGNGDRHFPLDDDDYGERVYFWHHLSLAGFYGPFDRPDSVAKILTPGLTAPLFSLSPGAVLTPQYRDGVSSLGDQHDRYDIIKNYLMFARWIEVSGVQETVKGAVDPQTAYQIDSKLDDGNGSDGRVVTFNQSAGTGNDCMTDDWTAPTGGASYILTNKDETCRMGFFF